MSDHLPSDIITTILGRLSVKSLLRFRSVSKSWLSMIESQEFNRLHIRQSMDTSSNLYLTVNGPDYQVYSIDFDSLDKANKIKNPFRRCLVLGSCNGILLVVDLGRRGEKKMALFNPATQTHQVLPNAPLPNSAFLSKSYHESVGFGCDSVKNDFKVVSMVKCDSFCETRIFSLKMSSWKKIKDFPYALPKKSAWGVDVKGALHTVVDQSTDSSGTFKLIVALDLAKEDYRSMGIPDDGSEKGSEFLLAKLRGDLTLSVYNGFTTEIWVMKEYGVVGSWTKLLSHETGSNLRTLGYSKAGDKVLLQLGDSHFGWYDFQSKSLFYAPVSGLPQCFYCNFCVENLLRLDESTKNKDQKEEVTDTEKSKRRDNLLALRFIVNLHSR